MADTGTGTEKKEVSREQLLAYIKKLKVSGGFWLC